MAGENQKSLSKKIFTILFVFSFLLTMAVAIASTSASFSSYEKEAEQSLLLQASGYQKTLSGLSEEDMCSALSNAVFEDARATLIDGDGTVIFDSYANPASMENHGTREEVLAAKESGQSSVMRKSETLGTDTLYVAVLVDNSTIFRLAQTRASLPSFLSNMALPLFVSLVLIFAVSILLSRFLTRRIVRPLQQIDLSRPLENDAYSELQPLLQRVDAQREELEFQNKALEEANEVRREFTSNVSHEMKTPLQVISGYAELIENEVAKPEDVTRFAGLIHFEANSMRTLIDDVLTLSRLDEQAEGSKMPVTLNVVAKQVVERLTSAAQERGISITIIEDTQAVVYGSSSSMEQMLYNLLDNAIKYNVEQGQVMLEIFHDMDHAYIAVIDYGPGIPDEAKSRIFERFYRVEGSRSRQTGGTGLGLAIVKHAAEAMGGHVDVFDALQDGPNIENKGSKFIVTLPLSDSRQ